MLANALYDPLLNETKLSLDAKSKSDHECTRYCLLTLTNLAVNKDNHPLLMSTALETLADFSKHRDIKCRQHAVFCIGNLCSNPDNLQQIMSSGILRTLITYAFPSSDNSSNVQFQAVAALRGLATHQILRVQIVREGALEPLIMSTKSNSIEVQREAAAAICNLAMSEENKVALARGGVLPVLINLAMSGDDQRELHATCALANIAEMVEGRTQERMIEEGVMKPLMRLTASPNAEIRREVARCFALFASKRDSHSTLVRIHAATKMMNFLQDSDEIAKRYGVLGLGNLAVSRESHQELFDVGAIALLIDCAKAPDLLTKRAVAFAFNNIAANSQNHTVCERLGLTRALTLLLQDADKDTNLQATLSTRRLCESAKFRNQFVDLNGIPVLLALGLSTEDIEMKREIAATLRNVSLSVHGKVVIIREKGLRLLAEYLQSPDVEICHQSTGVIANLAEATENQALMVDEGIIQHLKYVLNSKSLDIQCEACRALANLSAEYTYAPIIASSGTIGSLVSALASPNFLCQRYAAMGLGNLACHSKNQRELTESGALPVLFKIAKFENADLESQRYAALALTNLTASPANHAIVIQQNILPLFSTFLAHQDIEIRNTSLLGISNLATNSINHNLIMAEHLLPKIIEFLSKSDKQAQLRAVSTLRGLSTDMAIRTEIVESAGAVDAILELAKSEDVEIQMESLACLCNLSLCGCIGENPLSFLDSVSMQHLIAYLCSADSTFRLFGAVTIGNIASKVPLQDSIMSSGALIPLITMANQADYETQRCIAYALVNLSADPAKRRDIVREGGLLSLISLACSDDLQDALVALSALRGISSHPENRRELYQANILEALKLGTRANSIEIRCETAAIINAISINDENKLEMASEDSVISNVIILLQENKAFPRILRPAMASLANLSERNECHPYLRRHQIHNLILEFFEYGSSNRSSVVIGEQGSNLFLGEEEQQQEDIGIVREATRCLSNLASIHENHPPIVSGGGIKAFVVTARHNDALITRFSTLGLLNLSTLPENHIDLVTSGTCDILIRIANRESRHWNQLDPLGETIAEDDFSEELLTPRSKKEFTFLTSNGFDLESCRYAALALGNLAITTATHAHLLNETCVGAVNACLLSSDPETRFNAAFALNKLAIFHDNNEFLGNQEIIANLINLLTIDEEYEAKGQATACLRHLSYHIDNRFRMLSGLVFNPLAKLASETKDPEILREICALTTQLSLSDGLRYPLTCSPLLSELSKLMNHLDVEIGRFACASMSNLAEAKRTHKILVSTGNMIHIMINLMRSNHASIARESARGISNLMSSRASHRLFLDDNGLLSLFRLSRSLDDETLHHCSLIFRKLSPATANHEYIVSKGGLAPLIILSSNINEDIALQAAAAIRDLASNLNFKTVIADEGGLKKAIQLACHDSLAMRIIGMGILRHLSVNTRIKKPILENNGLIPMFKAVEHLEQDLDLLRQTAAVFGNIAENNENQITLIKDQCLPYLIHLARVDSNEIEQDIAKTFALLTSNTENQVNVFGYDEIYAILYLINKSKEENCLRDSLISLGNLAITGKNQLMIVKLGGLSIIQRMLENEFETVQRYTCRLLYRLAAHSELQEQMMIPSVLTLLNELLRGDSSLIRKYILMIYCNLSSNERNRLAMAQAGVISPIIFNLAHQEEVICRYAAMALTNLATEPSNQEVIAKLGGIHELIILASKEGYEGARYAGMALANLATNRMNRNIIVDSLGLIPLVKMANSKNIETQRASGLSFYNISCAMNNHIAMVKADVIPSLAILGKTEDLECKTYAIMTMANITANSETRILGTRSGALQTAIGLLKDDDINIRRYACIALCNMANNSTTQEQIVVHGALPSVLQMAIGTREDDGGKGGSNKNSSSKSKIMSTSKLATIKFENKLAASIANKEKEYENEEDNLEGTTSIQGRTSTGYDPLLDGFSDIESRRLALLTLNNLASNELNHSALINKGYLKICIDCFAETPSDSDIQTYAAFGVANLCSNPDYLALIGRNGGVPLLMHLSKSSNSHCLSLGLAALRRLANNEENWSLLISFGILDSLASAGLSRYLEIQREVAAALCSLSLSTLTAHRIEIAYKCLPTLVTLTITASKEYQMITERNQPVYERNHQEQEETTSMNTNKEFESHSKTLLDIARQSIGAIANLAEDIDTHEYIAKANASKAIIALESFHNIDIQREATRGVANLLSSFRHQNAVIEEGIPGLVSLSYADDLEACYHSALSFRKLTPNIQSHSLIVYNDGFKALFHLLSMPNLTIQLQAASALRDLSANPDYKLKCAEDGGIPLLVNLIRQSNEHLQALALASLRHLSLDPLLKIPILQERALRPVLKTIASNIEDIQLQAAGLLGNLSEAIENQVTMVEEGSCLGCLTLAFAKNDEIQQDTARTLANLASNEENHLSLYKQGALTALIHLSKSALDITQKYAAMGLRFLASNPEVRIFIVQNKEIGIFKEMASTDASLEYRRTAANSFASFTLHENNKLLLVQSPGVIEAILSLMICEDLTIQRDATFAIANLTDTSVLQHDLLREGVLFVLKDMANKATDVRVQRDLARCYANISQLEDIRQEILKIQSLPGLLNLSKSLDSACQRYATLALCNLSSSSLKASLIEQGILRSLLFLMKFPDPEIQRYSSLAIAGLALGQEGNTKSIMIQEGIMKPLVDLLCFPEELVQLSACLAVNALTLGTEMICKSAVVTEGGIEALLSIINSSSSAKGDQYEMTKGSKGGAPDKNTIAAATKRQLYNAVVYCCGSVCESEEVKMKFVELSGISSIIRQYYHGDIEMKRAIGYCLATISEQIEYHNDIEREGALNVIIALASLEDIESQEYAAFSLAHLASNRDLQVKLVNLGVVKPLVTMLSSDTEPKHYAGLALLKLADNFENHLKIAEEGGIQALLRLGRTRTTDEQLQYKAALTLGQLASNAVKLLPTASSNIAPISHQKMETLNSTVDLGTTEVLGMNAKTASSLGAGGSGNRSRVEKLRNEIQSQKEKAKEATLGFLDSSLNKTQTERNLSSTALDRTADSAMVTRSLDTGLPQQQFQTPLAAGKKDGDNGRPGMTRSASNDITPLHPTFNPSSASGPLRQSNSAGNNGTVNFGDTRQL
jgi:hypothetical protein